MDREKILDKIKKCMALGASPNEHEAAAAMRQAQKLMERHGITEAEIGAIGYAVEKVMTTVQATKTIPVTIACIASLIARAFGVRPVITRTLRVSDHNFEVQYFGPEHRVILAGHTHVVISRAVEKAWQEYILQRPAAKSVRGARASFYLGWCDTVTGTVQDFGMSDEETSRTSALVEKTFPIVRKGVSSNVPIYGEVERAGADSGKGFQLHRPMTGTVQLKLR